MLSTALVNPKDDEDLALTLNGKKKRINRRDFESAFYTMKLDTKQQANIFRKMETVKNKWVDFIQLSFSSSDFKEKYIELLNERFSRLNPSLILLNLNLNRIQCNPKLFLPNRFSQQFARF